MWKLQKENSQRRTCSRCSDQLWRTVEQSAAGLPVSGHCGQCSPVRIETFATIATHRTAHMDWGLSSEDEDRGDCDCGWSQIWLAARRFSQYWSGRGTQRLRSNTIAIQNKIVESRARSLCSASFTKVPFRLCFWHKWCVTYLCD